MVKPSGLPGSIRARADAASSPPMPLRGARGHARGHAVNSRLSARLGRCAWHCITHDGRLATTFCQYRSASAGTTRRYAVSEPSSSLDEAEHGGSTGRECGLGRACGTWLLRRGAGMTGVRRPLRDAGQAELRHAAVPRRSCILHQSLAGSCWILLHAVSAPERGVVAPAWRTHRPRPTEQGRSVPRASPAVPGSPQPGLEVLRSGSAPPPLRQDSPEAAPDLPRHAGERNERVALRTKSPLAPVARGPDGRAANSAARQVCCALLRQCALLHRCALLEAKGASLRL